MLILFSKIILGILEAKKEVYVYLLVFLRGVTGGVVAIGSVPSPPLPLLGRSRFGVFSLSALSSLLNRDSLRTLFEDCRRGVVLLGSTALGSVLEI